MSRAVSSRSRIEKPSRSASVLLSAASAHEIVPGKFNEHDWYAMHDRDDACDLVNDIVEEVTNNTLKVIYQNYLQKQLIPFTVLHAKEAMVQIIEWRFLKHDDGELDISNNVSWATDEEPEPIMIDSWAQGVVPVIKEAVEETIAEEEQQAEIGGAMEQSDYRDDHQQAADLHPDIPCSMLFDTADVSQVPDPCHEVIPLPAGSSRAGQLASKLKLKPKPVSEEVVSVGEPSTVKSSRTGSETPASIAAPDKVAKISGRPPARDVIYDESGNIVSIRKIDPARLPTHSVRPNYCIVDPNASTALFKLRSSKLGRRATVPLKAENPPSPDMNRRKTDMNDSIPQQKRAPLPPPMLESMNVSPGVIVRERDRVKKGQKQRFMDSDLLLREAMNRGLKPLSMRSSACPRYLTSEFTNNETPVIKAITSPHCGLPVIQTPPVGQH